MSVKKNVQSILVWLDPSSDFNQFCARSSLLNLEIFQVTVFWAKKYFCFQMFRFQKDCFNP